MTLLDPRQREYRLNHRHLVDAEDLVQLTLQILGLVKAQLLSVVAGATCRVLVEVVASWLVLHLTHTIEAVHVAEVAELVSARCAMDAADALRLLQQRLRRVRGGAAEAGMGAGAA